jgi:hypothetical protein
VSPDLSRSHEASERKVSATEKTRQTTPALSAKMT